MNLENFKKMLEKRKTGEWSWSDHCAYLVAVDDMLPKLLRVAKYAKETLDLRHREYDHTLGCPNCDAYRNLKTLLDELEK